MKSLKHIQTLFRIGSLLITIIRIFCIVSSVFCGVAVVFLATAKGMDAAGIELGQFTLHFVSESVGESFGKTVVELSFSLVSSLVEIYICNQAKLVFELGKELPTPFCNELPEKLWKLGFRVILTTFVTEVFFGIAFAIVGLFVKELGKYDATFAGNIGIGIAMLIVAKIFQYGAEVADKNQLTKDQLQ